MKLEEALNNVTIACNKYVGTKADHIALEQSLNTIGEKLTPFIVVERAEAKQAANTEQPPPEAA